MYVTTSVTWLKYCLIFKSSVITDTQDDGNISRQQHVTVWRQASICSPDKLEMTTLAVAGEMRCADVWSGHGPLDWRIKRARLSSTVPSRPGVDGRRRRRGIYLDTVRVTRHRPHRMPRRSTTLTACPRGCLRHCRTQLKSRCTVSRQRLCVRHQVKWTQYALKYV